MQHAERGAGAAGPDAGACPAPGAGQEEVPQAAAGAPGAWPAPSGSGGAKPAWPSGRDVGAMLQQSAASVLRALVMLPQRIQPTAPSAAPTDLQRQQQQQRGEDREPGLDLGGWGTAFRSAVDAASAQLSALRGSVPLAVRQALLCVLTSPSSGDPRHVLRLALLGAAPTTSRPGAPAAQAPDAAAEAEALAALRQLKVDAEWELVHSDGGESPGKAAALREARQLSSHRQLPLLFPAGQLFYVPSPEAEGDGRMRVVPAGAPFFGRVRVTRSALRDHRSRTYRAALARLAGRTIHVH